MIEALLFTVSVLFFVICLLILFAMKTKGRKFQTIEALMICLVFTCLVILFIGFFGSRFLEWSNNEYILNKNPEKMGVLDLKMNIMMDGYIQDTCSVQRKISLNSGSMISLVCIPDRFDGSVFKIIANGTFEEVLY
jgi:hypothetical protein